VLIAINKVPSSVNTEQLRQRVEAAYGAPVVGMLPLCEEIAELASSGIFVNRHPRHAVTAQLRSIADRIMS
jgi:MinD-like ATPase involved in chromosome partitioning or flagellar assembly